MDTNKSHLLIDKDLTKIYGKSKHDERRMKHTVLPIPSHILDPNFDPSSDADLSFLKTNVGKYSTLEEYYLLKDRMPSGIYCMPSTTNMLEWHGIIFIHKGIYKGASFKFVIFIHEKYPDIYPEVNFLNDVFHPLVDHNNGKLEYQSYLNKFKKRAMLVMIICYIKEVFYQEDLYFAKSANVQNHEALELLKNNKKEFLTKVQECINNQNENCYDDNQEFSFKLPDKDFEKIDAISNSIQTIGRTKPISDREETLFNLLSNRMSLY